MTIKKKLLCIWCLLAAIVIGLSNVSAAGDEHETMGEIIVLAFLGDLFTIVFDSYSGSLLKSFFCYGH